MAKDQFTKHWITENSINIIQNYSPGELTIRGLHYQLVGRADYREELRKYVEDLSSGEED